MRKIGYTAHWLNTQIELIIKVIFLYLINIYYEKSSIQSFLMYWHSKVNLYRMTIKLNSAYIYYRPSIFINLRYIERLIYEWQKLYHHMLVKVLFFMNKHWPSSKTNLRPGTFKSHEIFSLIPCSVGLHSIDLIFPLFARAW